GPNMLVIDPDECIDCTLCVAECPVEAIYAEDDVPPASRSFIALNAELAKAWKPIVERKPAPSDADEWAKTKDKAHLLAREAGSRLARAGWWRVGGFHPFAGGLTSKRAGSAVPAEGVTPCSRRKSSASRERCSSRLLRTGACGTRSARWWRTIS